MLRLLSRQLCCCEQHSCVLLAMLLVLKRLQPLTRDLARYGSTKNPYKSLSSILTKWLWECDNSPTSCGTVCCIVIMLNEQPQRQFKYGDMHGWLESSRRPMNLSWKLHHHWSCTHACQPFSHSIKNTSQCQWCCYSC